MLKEHNEAGLRFNCVGVLIFFLLCEKFSWLCVNALRDIFKGGFLLLMAVVLWCFGNFQTQVCFESS